MKKFNVNIEITTNARVTPEIVAKTIRQLIDCGLSDAQDTIESGEGDVKSAKLATDLNISRPVVSVADLTESNDDIAGSTSRPRMR